MEQYPKSAPIIPSSAQQARVTALNRFNRLYIYLPVGLLTAVFLGLSAYLLYLAISPPAEDTHRFLSGVADLILIVWLLPVVALFSLSMLAIIGGYVYYWYVLDEAERPLPPAPAYGRIRTFLWRVDNALAYYLFKLRMGERRVVAPLIRAHGRWAYNASLFNNVLTHLKNFSLWR